MSANPVPSNDGKRSGAPHHESAAGDQVKYGTSLHQAQGRLQGKVSLELVDRYSEEQLGRFLAGLT